MLIFHGSSVEVKYPDVKHSRTDIDFGHGFYLTEDDHMAKKWACNKARSILNAYNVDFSSLEVKRLGADPEWLDYVIANRMQDFSNVPFDDNKYDVIIGPTADDKLFVTIDMYCDGLLSIEQALKVVNCMNYSEQIVFKNDEAIKAGLSFEYSKEITGFEKDNLKLQFTHDSRTAAKKTQELIRSFNGR